MNNTEHIHRRALGLHRLTRWPVITLCLALALSRAVAADAYYINNAIVAYPGTVEYPPEVDATNFVNNDSFIINFTMEDLLTLTQPFYESLDTLNYTNNGLLMADTGFQFDTESSGSGLRTQASSFFNPGTVSCGSVNDIGAPFFGGITAQCLVNATNILNPGEVDVGTGGLIQFTGQSVDLSQSLLTVEGGGGSQSGTAVVGIYPFPWDPTANLGPNFATSADFPIPPFQLNLTNSIAYFDARMNQGTNIIRAVFIQDTSGSNVSVSVYLDPDVIDVGRGFATIQWAASYLDPASGNTYSNFLYMEDDFAGGATGNTPINGNGVPQNFAFLENGSTPLAGLPPPTVAGFYNVFYPGGITNAYTFANVQLISGISTNTVANQNVTNLPGRVEIQGANYLNLVNSQITGQNYMSLLSTNNFAGSAGALIQTPYSDLNLGQRYGYLYLTNVMQANLPVWGGNIQAWNTRWILTTDTVTNDYRILIVGSQVTPTLAAQVQNLILQDYTNNQIVISDTFNVMNTFYADSQSLTLTTNPPGNGATSFDGELNLEPLSIFWQNSVPNLRFLTNNGAIRMQNLALFGYPFFTNVTLFAASNTLSKTATGTNVVKKDKVTIGTNQYLFVAKLTNSIANQVAIVTNSLDGSLNNLIAAINGAAGAGVSYSTNTVANPVASAGPLANHAFTVTALAPGPGGNSIATVFTPATAAVNLTWGGHATLYDGLAVTNVQSFLTNTAFINDGIFMDQGSIIYAGNFVGSGIFSNGIGSFTLQSLTTTLTNEILEAAGDVSITASSLVTSNLVLQASRSLALRVTNVLTAGQTNNSYWSVGSASVGFGLSLPIKPVTGDLLGTTIHLSAPTNRTVVNVWAGSDYGISPSGFANNEAVEQLILDVATPAIGGHYGVLSFNGASISNALYVDQLVLTNYATQGSNTFQFNFPWLHISTNMVIYYARAILYINGVGYDDSEAIDQAAQVQGANGMRLRWVSSYAGYLSSTNFYYTNSQGTVIAQPENIALANSTDIDSDSDGIVNAYDPTPFFLPPELNFTASVTNLPPKMVKVEWTTIPHATNFVYYTTNLLLPVTNWLHFTKSYYGGGETNINTPFTNSVLGVGFISPQGYNGPNVLLPDNGQQTNVWIYDSITNVPPRYYRVVVSPWLNYPQ